MQNGAERVQGSGFGDQLSALSFQPMVGRGPDARNPSPHLNGPAKDATRLPVSARVRDRGVARREPSFRPT